MRIYITEELAKYHHLPTQDTDRYCLVAQALTMQAPLPEEYYWSVGYNKIYIRGVGGQGTVEVIDLPPPVRRIIRNYDNGVKNKVTFFQI
jgi:hypothetical protein